MKTNLIQRKFRYLGVFMICVMVFSVSSFAGAQTGFINPGGTGGSGSQISGASDPCPSGTICNPLKVNSIGAAINTAVEIFTYLALMVAVVMIIIVGFNFIRAQGKPEKLKEAGSWLLAIVIGVAIVLGARLMISVVISTLGATGAVSKEVINGSDTIVSP